MLYFGWDTWCFNGQWTTEMSHIQCNLDVQQAMHDMSIGHHESYKPRWDIAKHQQLTHGQGSGNPKRRSKSYIKNLENKNVYKN